MLMISLGMRYHSGEGVFGNLTARRRSDSPGKTAKSRKEQREARCSSADGTVASPGFPPRTGPRPLIIFGKTAKNSEKRNAWQSARQFEQL